MFAVETPPDSSSLQVIVDFEQCLVCGKTTTVCCSRCRKIFYCSQSCQRLDWRTHKITCVKAVEHPIFDAAVVIREDTEKLPGPEKAGEVLKQGLMIRFGSIVAAYEWFDAHSEGLISESEFSKLTVATGVTDKVLIKELFTALDRTGEGKISLSGFLSEAVKKLKPSAAFPPQQPEKTDKSFLVKTERHIETPMDPSHLPPGRRALRAASILAFRNGRYDDAVVSALQALGITSSSAKSVASLSGHPDNLVEVLLLLKAYVKQGTKGDALIDLVQRIIPSDGPKAVEAFPSHVYATILATIGDLLDQYGRPDLAQRYYSKYLGVISGLFGSDSVVYGDALTIVCAFYFRNSKILDAVETAHEAKKIRTAHLASPHARIADALANYGAVLRAGAREDEAVQEFKEALTQRIKLFGATSLPSADCEYSLGSLYLDLAVKPTNKAQKSDMLDNATKLLRGAHDTRLKILGPRHADTLAAAEGLRRLAVVEAPPPVKKIRELPHQSPRIDRSPSVKLRRRQTSDSGSSSSQSSPRSSPPATVSSKPGSLATVTESTAPIVHGAALKLEFADPNSPLAKAYESLGPEEFTEALLRLDTKVIGSTDFVIDTGLPKKAAPRTMVVLKVMYFKKVLEDEEDAKSVEYFFQDLKGGEGELRLIFKLLNQIFINVHNDDNGSGFFGSSKEVQLTVANFSEFINSKSQNVQLIQYFAETLAKENPKMAAKILDQLQLVADVAEIDMVAFLHQLECQVKSMAKIEADLKKLTETPSMPPEEKLVVGAAIRYLPEIKQLREALDARTKIIGAGLSILMDLWMVTQPKLTDNINGMIDCLDEFYQLLREYIDGSDDEER